MAYTQLAFRYTTGRASNLAALLWARDRSTMRTSGTTMTAIASIADANYAGGRLSATEKVTSGATGTGVYILGAFPVVAAGYYVIEIYDVTTPSASSPAPSDTPLEPEIQVYWDGVDTLHVGLTDAENNARISKLPAITAGAAGGVFIAGTNAATTISSSTGSALTLTSTGGNGSGLASSGNGSGHGALLTAGATGNGISSVVSAGNGHGMRLEGFGTGEGLSARGGASGHGIHAIGGTSAGDGINAQSVFGGDGLHCVGDDTGHGLHAEGGPSGDDIHLNNNDAPTLTGIVWNAARSSYTTAGSFGQGLGAGIVRSNTAAAGANGSITLDASASATNDLYNGLWCVLIGGTGAGQARLASDYDGGTKVLTVVPNWITNPDNTSVFALLPHGASDLSTQAKADVNAEVLDVLNVDTFAEPGKEAPPTPTTLVKKIGYLYKFLRNKKTQTATTLSVFADDESTVDQQATISDDATTYTHGEIAAGP